MSQQYYVQNMDDMKMYSGLQVVQLTGDDIGVSSLSRPQHLVLQDDQIVYNDGDQVVYQTTNQQPQYQQQQQQQQPPQQQQQQATATHYIINDDMTAAQHQVVQQQHVQQQQQQQQIVYQQAPQQQQQQQQPPPLDHRHQQQQAPPPQHHYQQQQPDPQQYTQDGQMQQQQQQHIQQQQQQQQTPPQQQQQQQQTHQIYYTSEQVLQPGTIVQHTHVPPPSSPQVQQQQLPKTPQYQTQSPYQQQQQQTPPQQQIVHQQHAVLQQSPHHHQQQPQQQTIQLQTPPQQTQQQIVYRMAPTQQQPQQTTHMNVLNNTHVIVQQPSGQQVLIQSPQHPDIMRQSMPQRIIYNNRLVYTTPPPQQQQQQVHQTIMQHNPQQQHHPQQQQQQHIQLQTNQLQHQTPHLVQTRVAPQQTAPQQQTQQAAQQNVVYHQIQTIQKPPGLQPTQQVQTQQQLVTTSGQQVVRTATTNVSYRPKITRGGMAAATLITRPPGLTTQRQVLMTNTNSSIVRQVRPRGGAAGGIARGGARPAGVRAQRPVGVVMNARNSIVQTATNATLDGQTVQVVTQQQQQHPQLVQTKPYTIASLSQQQQLQTPTGALVRPVYRTQIVETMPQQQQQQQQPTQGQIIQGQQVQPIRATSSIKYITKAAVVSNANVAGGSNTTTGNNIDMDIEESIQASMVKKDHQKPMAAAGPMQLGGNTTLTTFYNTEPPSPANSSSNDDEQRGTSSGSSMSLAEFKKRNLSAGNASPTNSTMSAVGGTLRPVGGVMRVGNKLQVTPTNTPALSSLASGGNQTAGVPVARVLPQLKNATIASAATTQLQQRQPTSSVQQTSHNNFEIHSQHVLNNRAGMQIAERDRNSAKMLVILVSGEQRLITFTLPRESCTVQDLLEQVGVPFDNSTTIQCVEHHGANVDFVVTVGFSVNESASELISRAEESLQINRQHEQQSNSTNAANNAAAVAAATAATNQTTAPSTVANNAASAAAAAAALARQNHTQGGTTTTAAAAASTTNAEELPRKHIPGFLAVCSFCGFTGMDHAKCERCKRIFHEPPKRLPCTKSTATSTSSTDSASSPSAAGARSTDEKKPTTTTTVRKVGVNFVTTTVPTRGRATAVRGGRSRSGRRPAEAETVTLTLSSDEEQDDNSNMEANNALSKSANTTAVVNTKYEALPFEPILPIEDESAIYTDFIRTDISNLTESKDKFSTKLVCKCIRIGNFRFISPEPVIFTSLGVRITAPVFNDLKEFRTLDIQKNEVVKTIAHFSTKSGTKSMLTIYTLLGCADYIKRTLKLNEDGTTQQDNSFSSANHICRRIIMEFDNVTDQARNVIKSIWHFLDEISSTDAELLLVRASGTDRQMSDNKSRILQPNENVLLLIYPPGTGGISIRTDDYLCLAKEQYLNDIIIDFYLKWVHNNIIPVEQRERTFIFSTFFYKRLTTMTRNADPKKNAAQKRHARVQKWTKNLNLFDKDYIIIPINEQSHWFLAIICFPWLKGPVTADTNVPVELQQPKRRRGKKVALQIGNTTITPLSKRENNAASSTVLPEICRIADDDSERDEAEGDDSEAASEDSDNSNLTAPSTSLSAAAATSTQTPSVVLKETAPATTTTAAAAATSTTPAAGNGKYVECIKQPLVLIFDSLATNNQRGRVMATLREYLTCEYEIKKPDAPAHKFDKNNMPGHDVTVPQQNNFTDCGLFVLQYVEQFFLDPIRDYRLPIQLTNWFDTLTVTKKREDISILLQRLMDENNSSSGQRLILPAIPFPTLNGQLIECPEDGENAEFEEEEGDEEAAEEEEQNTTSEMEVDQSSEEQNKSSSSSSFKSTSNTLNTNSSVGAIVATAGRKIVLKRRLPISAVAAAAAANATSPSNGETQTPTTSTPHLTTTPGVNSVRQMTALKIRKLDP